MKALTEGYALLLPAYDVAHCKALQWICKLSRFWNSLVCFCLPGFFILCQGLMSEHMMPALISDP